MIMVSEDPLSAAYRGSVATTSSKGKGQRTCGILISFTIDGARAGEALVKVKGRCRNNQYSWTIDSKEDRSKLRQDLGPQMLYTNDNISQRRSDM